MGRLSDWIMGKPPEDSDQNNTNKKPSPKKRKDFPSLILALMREDKSNTRGYYTKPMHKKNQQPPDNTPSSAKPTKPKQ